MTMHLANTILSLRLAICLALHVLHVLHVPLHAEEVRLAVAANFSNTIKPLAARFERESGHKILISLGASGKFYTQIRQGAPFHLLLAADSTTPQKLVQDGKAIASSRRTYALGQLVLWSANNKTVDAKALVLNGAQFRHLALAQPKLAPYGLAAKQVLEKLQLWDKLQVRLVYGENVGQTLNFIASGNAELGFIALAQIRSCKEGVAAAGGSCWLVPPNLHEPIRQQMVLLGKAPGNPAAQAFWHFMQSPAAQDIIRADGYEIESP